MVVKTLYKMFKYVPTNKIILPVPTLLEDDKVHQKLEVSLNGRTIRVAIQNSKHVIDAFGSTTLFSDILPLIPEADRNQFLAELAIFEYIHRDGEKITLDAADSVIAAITNDTISILKEHLVSEKVLEKLKGAAAVIPLFMANVYGNVAYQLYVDFRDAIRIVTGIGNTGFSKTYIKLSSGYYPWKPFTHKYSDIEVLPSFCRNPLILDSLSLCTISSSLCTLAVQNELQLNWLTDFPGQYLIDIHPTIAVLMVGKALKFPQALDELLAKSLEKLKNGMQFDHDDQRAINRFLRIVIPILEDINTTSSTPDSSFLKIPPLKIKEFLKSRYKVYRSTRLPLKELIKQDLSGEAYWTVTKTKSGKSEYRLHYNILPEKQIVLSLGNYVYILFSDEGVPYGYRLTAEDFLALKEEVLSFYYNYENYGD